MVRHEAAAEDLERCPVSCAVTDAATRAPLQCRNVLTFENGRLVLGGKPFAEIGFNKFDLTNPTAPPTRGGRSGPTPPAIGIPASSLSSSMPTGG